LGAPYRNTPDYSTALSEISYRKTNSRLITPSNLNTLPFYRIRVAVDCRDRVGLLRDIGIELANLGVNIYEMNVEDIRTPDHAIARVHLVIEVVDLQQLRNMFVALEGIDGILEFHRVADMTDVPAKGLARKSSKRSDAVS
jgi:(p)ppGpp synthase/HD superfamily hydrolase